MGQLTRAQTIGIVALLIVVTGWVGVTVLHTGQTPSTPGIVVREAQSASGPIPPHADPSGSQLPAPSSAAAPGTPDSEIVVHVAGAVQKPGVYRLKPGARNDDAVHAAGGFTASANPDAINLAAHTEDGSQLYIPTRAERPSGGIDPQAPAPLPSASRGASVAPTSHTKSAKGSGASTHSSNKLTDPSQGQINLNTADSAQLQRIPGIGPAMAERILAYRRTAGHFQSPDDLLQISGIGDKKYQKMKPFLTAR